jgi:hypothetical protein
MEFFGRTETNYSTAPLISSHKLMTINSRKVTNGIAKNRHLILAHHNTHLADNIDLSFLQLMPLKQKGKSVKKQSLNDSASQWTSLMTVPTHRPH